MVDVELFYIEILPVWTYFSCIYECIFKMFEKIKKENVYKEFLYLFLQSLFAKILLTEVLFFPFSQLCIALEILL